MADQKGLVKSPFTISKNSDGSTWLSADTATSTSWFAILTYAVPLGTAIEITPVNYHFGTYKLTDGTAITGGNTRILKKNAAGTESREIWSGSNAIFLAVGDIRQRPSLRVGVLLNSSENLVVQVASLGTTLDVSVSDFQLEATQYYKEV